MRQAAGTHTHPRMQQFQCSNKLPLLLLLLLLLLLPSMSGFITKFLISGTKEEEEMTSGDFNVSRPVNVG